MAPASGIEICPLDTVGITEFQMPSSHETNLVQIAPGTIDDLFVHHFQTDQLIVVRGSLVLAVLENGTYRYIWMSECDFKVVRIPPGVPHGAINLSDATCIAINSVIRHGAPYARDYQPLAQPIPYDLEAVRALAAKLQAAPVASACAR
ncbi:MAG: cupin domain-containing protein [Alkalinema sp. RL_2_19]|nr:cupin domain-containing protein [Alkalinema sp. RL_2_19]